MDSLIVPGRDIFLFILGEDVSVRPLEHSKYIFGGDEFSLLRISIRHTVFYSTLIIWKRYGDAGTEVLMTQKRV